MFKSYILRLFIKINGDFAVKRVGSDVKITTAWKVSVWIFLWSAFFRIRTEYGDLFRKSP